MKVVIASGYFNPIHKGHIEYLEKAKELGDYLFVIVNNDIQAELKRGVASYMEEKDRFSIVNALRCVDGSMISIDKDATVVKSIAEVYTLLIKEVGATEIIFAKGGDRFVDEIPESSLCDKLDIDIVDGLGEKIRNSSDYINK
jgi:cytidyltransferase-like protein